MKFYLILSSFLILGILGFFYAQNIFLTNPKSSTQNSRQELETIRNELSAIKAETAEIQASNLALKNESLKLKEDSDKRELIKQRNDCILNQRNIQQFVRGYQNTNQLNIGDPLDFTALIASGAYMTTMPECPCGKPYVLAKTIPPIGKLVATCSHIDKGGQHVPPKFSDW
jgi:hypothetical protein